MPKRKHEAATAEKDSRTSSLDHQTSSGRTCVQQRGKTAASTTKSKTNVTEPKDAVNRPSSDCKHQESLEKVHEDDHQVVHKLKVKKNSLDIGNHIPLITRTAGHKLFIGAHVSSAGGVQNSILNGMHVGANAFALFLKSQRKWKNPPLTTSQSKSFIHNCQSHSYDPKKHVLPHGSYLVNLAHTDAERTKQAYDTFLDDLKRCESLGIMLYNFHPGNTVGNDRSTAIAHLASNLNRAHAATKEVVTLLENMAAGGNVLGSTFEDLRDIIALVTDKSRIGVCIDTCHAFAAGYDMRTREAFATTMEHFDRTVGIKYLRAVHLNDSKAPFASYRDLHANIGTGFIGLRGFHAIVNDSRLAGIPIILETPIEVRNEEGELVKDSKGKALEDKGIWAREIKLVESLLTTDPESVEFRELESRLSQQGKPERMRLLEQQQRKLDKSRKKAVIKMRRRPSSKEAKDEDTYASHHELSLTDSDQLSNS